MRQRITWLAALTGAAILGIIMLQVSWLKSSFDEKHTSFRADVENALNATILKLQVAAAAAPHMDSVRHAVLASNLSDALAELVQHMPGSSRTVQLHIGSDSIQKNILSQEVLQAPDGPTGMIPMQPGTIQSYKEVFNKELRLRGIDMTGELALVNRNGSIVSASCDTNSFKNLPVLTDVGIFSVDVTGKNEVLQAGFPEISFYLLRRMAWIFSFSVLLILIAIISFSYLVIRFFRQKKIADIRNDFMNNMTHELKTPISSVSVALELMHDAQTTLPAREEYYSIAQGELKRLTMLVEKVLQMAAFEKSEIRISKRETDAAAWLQETTAALKPLFRSRQVDLQTAVQPGSITLYADLTHMTNVLQNLADNAVKYNDKTNPQVSIHITEDAQHTVITVADNGKGIPQAYTDKIFDKFFRVPSGDVHDVKGYGLGLSYVKAVVLLHDGNIHVISKAGEGSTFIIQLPKQGPLHG